LKLANCASIAGTPAIDFLSSAPTLRRIFAPVLNSRDRADGFAEVVSLADTAWLPRPPGGSPPVSRLY
jgi:hypothetical protein